MSNKTLKLNQAYVARTLIGLLRVFVSNPVEIESDLHIFMFVATTYLQYIFHPSHFTSHVRYSYTIPWLSIRHISSVQ